MVEFTKEYIRSVRMCSYLIEPPASEVIEHLCDEIERQAQHIEELEQDLSDQSQKRLENAQVSTDRIIALEGKIRELEHYKRLNEEWAHEKVDGLTTFEEIEKMVMIADRINKSNASVRCGWCDAEFETRDEVKEHAYGCKDNPLAQRIEKYNHLIVNLFSFLERDRLVRSHAKEMSEFIQEYREIKDGE